MAAVAVMSTEVSRWVRTQQSHATHSCWPMSKVSAQYRAVTLDSAGRLPCINQISKIPLQLQNRMEFRKLSFYFRDDSSEFMIALIYGLCT